MTATCKLCGATIQTEPDNMFDEGRQARERAAFFQEIARHIEPRFKNCTARDQKTIPARMNQLTQDNGWFQRWRMLWLVETTDAHLREKAEEWREYLHSITRPVEPGQPEPQKPDIIQ
jgi:hypothetical protein